MRKKQIVCIMVVLLFASLLPGCSSQEEYGTIEDVEITAPEEPERGSSIFTKQEPPFADYHYKSNRYECAGFSFDMPTNWTTEVCNYSCIRFDTPDDDPHIPASTGYIKCLYDYDASGSGLDQFSGIANEFGKPMSPYLTGLPFRYNGRELWVQSFTVSDEQNVPSFTSDDKAAVIKVTRDILLTDKKSGRTDISAADLITAYFRWENFPVMIAMTVPGEYTERAEAMVSYIMSSVAGIPRKITQMKACEAEDLTFSVPAYFEANSTGNILRAPLKSTKSCAGMCIGIFSLEEEPEKLTDSYFLNNYLDNITKALLPEGDAKGYEAASTAYEYSDKKIADEIKTFVGTTTIIGSEEDYIAAKNPFGTESVWIFESFIIKRKTRNLIVALIYPPNEADIAPGIEKKLLESISVH